MTPERNELDGLLREYEAASEIVGQYAEEFRCNRQKQAREALIAFVDRLTERKESGKRAMDAAEEIMLYVSRRQPEIAMMNQYSLAEIIQKHMDATGSPRPENSTTPTESSCSKA